ncbi:hypothetical protein HFO55_31725 [Rhizobium leguminosarum]|nr:hypothetical protein [Rhizobium leguminosarum]MBY5578182.1 hypothetical protein [Rhizobium leguminosarum]MBY5585471.1 hypothetical protein [Rhizobium leguminosarum]
MAPIRPHAQLLIADLAGSVAPVVPLLRAPFSGETFFEQLSPDLFPIRSVDVDERPVRRRLVDCAAQDDAQSLFSQKLFQPSFGDQRQFSFFDALPMRADSGVSMPETNGTPSPSSRMFCPSHLTVSPSTTVNDAQIISPAIMNDISVLGCLELPPEHLFLFV